MGSLIDRDEGEHLRKGGKTSQDACLIERLGLGTYELVTDGAGIGGFGGSVVASRSNVLEEKANHQHQFLRQYAGGATHIAVREEGEGDDR